MAYGGSGNGVRDDGVISSGVSRGDW